MLYSKSLFPQLFDGWVEFLGKDVLAEPDLGTQATGSSSETLLGRNRRIPKWLGNRKYKVRPVGFLEMNRYPVQAGEPGIQTDSNQPSRLGGAERSWIEGAIGP